MSFGDKIRSESETLAWIERERRDGQKIGFTCGAFDLLHAGHVHYLEEARARCNRLLVAVNSDHSIRTYKGWGRPINAEDDRLRVIAALGCVDSVLLMPDTRPLRLLQLLQPDLYIKGGDYQAPALRSGDFVRSYGGQVLAIPLTHATSSTAIMRRIAALDMHEAGPESPQANPAKIVFLDRDGTLIRDLPFACNPDTVEILPGVSEGLRNLQEAGFRLVIVTNQQGIGLGYISREEFIAVNQRLLQLLGSEGIRISRIYYCPHSLGEQCVCRKPSPYLFERGLHHFNAQPEACFVIGDGVSDMRAGRSAGCHTALIGNIADTSADTTVGGFSDAAAWAISESSRATAQSEFTICLTHDAGKCSSHTEGA